MINSNVNSNVNSNECCCVSPAPALTEETIKMREMANAVLSNMERIYCHMFGDLKSGNDNKNEQITCFSGEIHATMNALNHTIDLQNAYLERMGVSR